MKFIKDRLTRLENRRPTHHITLEQRQAIIDAAIGGMTPEEIKIVHEEMRLDREAKRR